MPPSVAAVLAEAARAEGTTAWPVVVLVLPFITRIVPRRRVELLALQNRDAVKQNISA